MPTIDEKRVYAATAGSTPVYLASDVGVVEATVSGDRVGEFRVVHRTAARDVAFDGVLAVATDDDVLVGPAFAPTGFGEAVAVGCRGGAVLAAAPDGRVARLPAGAVDRAIAGDDEGGGDVAVDAEMRTRWIDLGRVGEVRAVDAPLVAAPNGVYRAASGDDPELAAVGLADAGVRDVAGRGVPLAATDDGLYGLANGWVVASGGAFDVVDADGDRAHAAGKPGVVARDDPGGSFAPVDAEFDPVAFGHLRNGVVAATAEGTLFADVGDGWRSRSVGARGVGGVAVVPQR